MKFLIVKPSSLGDIVHTLPAVYIIRKQFPDAFISWVVNEELVDFVRACPIVDDIIIFKRKRWGKLRYFHEFLFFLKEIKDQNFDVVYDFQGLFRTGVISYASGASKIIGFRNAREFATMFYSDKVAVPINLKNAVEKNFFMSQSILNIPETKILFPEFDSLPDSINKANKIFAKNEIDTDKHIIIAVAPETRWTSKRWNYAKFAKLMEELAEKEKNIRFWLIGTGNEKETGDKVIDCLDNVKPLNMIGKTDFRLLLELLKKTQILITNDSGPMHIAVALNIPVFAFFGPTDPELTGPYGDKHTVFSKQVECSICLQRECHMDKHYCGEVDSITELADKIINKVSKCTK